MKYSKKIEMMNKKYEQDFNRKDLTFAMNTIKCMIENIEKGEYNKDKYSKENINVILEYLFNEYNANMKRRYEKLNSKEYKESQWWVGV